MKPQVMFILVGPSGVGKSTLLEMVLKDFPNVKDVVTYTTRTKRPGEVEGLHYFFVDKEKFIKLRNEDFFIEWAEVHGNLYGTPHEQVRQNFANGHCVIMDVDVQGAKVIKGKYPQAFTVFIHPPSIDTLRHRLDGRDKGQTKDLSVRLKNAEREIKEAHLFDKQLINDELPQTYGQLKKIIEDLLRNR